MPGSRPSLTVARQRLDDLLERHPAPWRVGDRRNARLWPLRDGQDRIIAYFLNRDVAELVVDLRGSI